MNKSCKKKTIMKGQGDYIESVVGRDIGLSQITNIDGKNLVESFVGRRISLHGLSGWLRQYRALVPGYTPIARNQYQKGVVDLFLNLKKMQKTFLSALVARHIHTYFEIVISALLPYNEKMATNLVWVKLPKLPLEWWTWSFLQSVINSMASLQWMRT